MALRFRTSRRFPATLPLGLAAWALAGCITADPVIPLEVRTLPPALYAAVSHRQRLQIAVPPFEDARPAESRLGSRLPLWGDVSYFNLKGGEVGQVVAQVFADYLRLRMGWGAWLAKPGVKPPDGGAAFTLSGRVLAFETEVRSWLPATRIEARTQLEIRAVNGAGADPVILVLEGAESRWTLGFDPKDVQASLNQALLNSFETFVVQTAVEEGKLRRRTGSGPTAEPLQPTGPAHPGTPPP
jgi:hypothetical protein